MGEYEVRIFEGKDYTYQIRRPVKAKHLSSEYVKLAKALKTLVDTEGQGVYCDKTKLENAVSSEIMAQHIKMISAITSYISILLSKERFVDEATVTEQMYCALLREGFSRNIIVGLLYAVFFSLNKTLKLSGTEKKKLYGGDTFVYQSEDTINVTDNNIAEVETLIKQGDNNAKVELGTAILNGNIEKYARTDGGHGVINEEHAKRLLEEGLNHGNGKAAQVLGDNKLVYARNLPFSHDFYSKAYEYYTVYGAISNNNPKVSHSRIIDILNLGLFHQKMMFNFAVTAILLSLSCFIPFLLSLLNINTALIIPIKGCVTLTLFEMMTVVIGAVVRHIRPFFTQGWIVFLQFLIWFIAMIIMIP